MDTNKLIHKLADGLQPVKPLDSTPRRFLLWAFVAAAVLCVSFYITGVREDIADRFALPGFGLETLFLLMMAVLGVGGALGSSVPGPRRHWILWGLAVLGSFWIGHQVFLLGENHATLGPVVFHPGDEIVCSGLILIIGAFLVWPLFGLLRKAAPLSPAFCGALAGLGCAGLSACAMQFVCVNDHPAHVLVWHVVPVAGFIAGGFWLGRRFLKPPSSKI